MMSTNAADNSSYLLGRATELAKLIDDFDDRHIGELEALLSRLSQALDSAVERWSGRHPELVPLRTIFVHFREQLTGQLRRESGGLLSLARRLAVNPRASGGIREALRQAMHSMSLEMAASLAETEAMRRLAMDFVPPSHADLTYISAYRLLAELHRRLKARFDWAESELFPAIERVAAGVAVTTS